MKRRLPWLLGAVALLVLGLLVFRGLQGRRVNQASAAAAASAPATAVELAPGDALAARTVPLVRTLTVTGGLRAVNTAVVKAKVAAELAQLTVREGDTVQAGQVIGQLDTREVSLRVQQAVQTAESARAQRDIAQRALANNRALVAQGFISATGLETSVSNEAAAEASYRAAQAAADLARKAVGDARLVAPIRGTVSQRLVQPGERVSVDARIVDIVDLSRIELEAAVSPDDVGSVRVGQLARLTIDGLADPVEARVARINPSTQAGTRSVMVYLAVEPHPGLRQGLFARGTLELQRRPALVVPVNTVRIDQPRPSVLVLAKERAALVPVTLGERGEAVIDGRREAVVEVTAGLAEGAVVTRNAVGSIGPDTPVRWSAPAPPASPVASAASAP